jgi:5-methylcytosine-specific restriction enzyme A
VNWDSARKAALSRDGGKCQRCLRPAVDVHHRKPKQMGGTGNADTNFGAANLVSLCRPCHNCIHANPAESYQQGWLVHSWQDPADVPLKNPDVPLF